MSPSVFVHPDMLRLRRAVTHFFNNVACASQQAMTQVGSTQNTSAAQTQEIIQVSIGDDPQLLLFAADLVRANPGFQIAKHPEMFSPTAELLQHPWLMAFAQACANRIFVAPDGQAAMAGNCLVTELYAFLAAVAPYCYGTFAHLSDGDTHRPITNMLGLGLYLKDEVEDTDAASCIYRCHVILNSPASLQAL